MRKLLLRTSAPFVLEDSRARAKKLRSLAATEKGSYLTLKWAAQQTQSPERAALYLRHAADEARHAKLFWRRADVLEPHVGPLLADGEDLFRSLGERDFLAFVTHGERRGREQFEIYEAYFHRRGHAEDAALFSKVAADERHHETYSHKVLLELAGGDRQAKRSLRRIRRWEAWRSWRRAGRAVSLRLYSALIWALFPLILPYALLTRPLLKTKTGWLAERSRKQLAEPTDRGATDG